MHDVTLETPHFGGDFPLTTIFSDPLVTWFFIHLICFIDIECFIDSE